MSGGRLQRTSLVVLVLPPDHTEQVPFLMAPQGALKTVTLPIRFCQRSLVPFTPCWLSRMLSRAPSLGAPPL